MFLDYDKPRVHMHLSLQLLVHFALAAALLLATLTAPLADPRTPIPEHAGGWQRALFPLRIPVTRLIDGRMRHFTEHCTAVIVSPGPSPLIVTAWHCLDGYQSLLEPIRLTLPGDPPVAVQVVASGGSMEQDWAILKAMQPIAGRYWIPISQRPLKAGAKISAVGFGTLLTDPVSVANRDHRRELLADESCRVVDATFTKATSTCVARQGASGGAILSRTASGSVRVAGIISAGDGHSISLFYPTWFLLQRIRTLR